MDPGRSDFLRLGKLLGFSMLLSFGVLLSLGELLSLNLLLSLGEFLSLNLLLSLGEFLRNGSWHRDSCELRDLLCCRLPDCRCASLAHLVRSTLLDIVPGTIS